MRLSDWIAIAGVISTGIFSYLIWKATQQGTGIAKASYHLSESMIRSQQEIDEALRKEYRHKVLSKALKVMNKLFDILENNYYPEQLGEFPGLDLANEELVKYFRTEEREKIKNAFHSIEELATMLRD